MVAATTTTVELVVAVASILGGGGAVIALAKLRPERQSIITEAANNAVEAVNESLIGLRQQLVQAQSDIEHGRLERERLMAERVREQEEQRIVRHELKDRVAELEKATDLRNVMAALIGIKDSQKELLDAHERLVEMTSSQTNVLNLIAERLSDGSTTTTTIRSTRRNEGGTE